MKMIDQEQMNEYGVHPLYTVLEANGKSYGVLMLTSNAMGMLDYYFTFHILIILSNSKCTL